MSTFSLNLPENASMSERDLEIKIERIFNRLDDHYMNDPLTTEEYDDWCNKIASWEKTVRIIKE